MIESSADHPGYKQLAHILRHRIESGSFIEGEMLPRAATLRKRRRRTDTVLRALAVLGWRADQHRPETWHLRPGEPKAEVIQRKHSPVAGFGARC